MAKHMTQLIDFSKRLFESKVPQGCVLVDIDLPGWYAIEYKAVAPLQADAYELGHNFYTNAPTELAKGTHKYYSLKDYMGVSHHTVGIDLSDNHVFLMQSRFHPEDNLDSFAALGKMVRQLGWNFPNIYSENYLIDKFGNVHLVNDPEFVNSDIWLNGNLYIRNLRRVKLPKTLRLDGHLIVEKSDIIKAPNYLEVQGAEITDSTLTELASHVKVTAHLIFLGDNEMDQIGHTVFIGGNLNCDKQRRIKRIGHYLEIEGNLYSEGASIDNIPHYTFVKGQCFTRHSNLPQFALKDLNGRLLVAGDFASFNRRMVRDREGRETDIIQTLGEQYQAIGMIDEDELGIHLLAGLEMHSRMFWFKFDIDPKCMERISPDTATLKKFAEHENKWRKRLNPAWNVPAINAN